MIVARSTKDFERDPASVVTVGTFDGVHLGHQQIIRETVVRARARAGRSVVITFEPHPKEVVASSKGPVRLLTTMEERLERLQTLDIDLVRILTFTHEFSRLSARAFYETSIVQDVGVAEVVVGYDHMFGRDRKAGDQELQAMGKEFGFVVHTVPARTVGGERVSSTQVRNALLAGDVQRAERFLGYPYTLEGTVIVGDRRGRQIIGFPTANLSPGSARKVVPARGVYLVRVQLGPEERFGMMNIGVRPTVTNGSEQTLEVHIFGVEEELYGRSLAVSFLRKLRDEQRFSSLAELQEQLARDREQSMILVEQYHSDNR